MQPLQAAVHLLKPAAVPATMVGAVSQQLHHGRVCSGNVVAMQVANGCKFLTVGDEEGCVSIVDTRSEELPSSLYTDHERAPRAKWLAHNNTIFDMAWAKVGSSTGTPTPCC